MPRWQRPGKQALKRVEQGIRAQAQALGAHERAGGFFLGSKPRTSAKPTTSEIMAKHTYEYRRQRMLNTLDAILRADPDIKRKDLASQMRLMDEDIDRLLLVRKNMKEQKKEK